MNAQIIGLQVSSGVFGLMSLVQLLRVVLHADILVAGHTMPLWPSVVALFILAGLSLWLWGLSCLPVK